MLFLRVGRDDDGDDDGDDDDGSDEVDVVVAVVAIVVCARSPFPLFLLGLLCSLSLMYVCRLIGRLGEQKK